MTKQKSILLDLDQSQQHISLKEVEKGPLILDISASKGLLTSLCAQYDLLSFSSLQAFSEARKWRKEGIIIEGHLNAEFTQKCVVSLKPVPQVMKSAFSQKFAPADPHKADIEIEIDPLEDDDVEELEQGNIDLAAFLFEIFAVELDLYPRLSDAEIDTNYSSAASDGDDDERISPFAVLKGLKEQE